MEPKRLTCRQKRMGIQRILALTPILLLAACSQSDTGATWQLSSQNGVTDESTGFEAEVTRLACNSGETGEVLAPNVDYTDSQIVVTFEVAPQEPGAQDCQGNTPVTYRVELDQPVNGRELVDGACEPGAQAASTSFCKSSVRWTPRTN